MAHALDPIAQYQIVHEGIREVAARCNGAVTLDYKGFDGQDTHYGRRIAAVPFEKLTADDHQEIARLANKYREQILTYTGNNVADLPVVIEAKSFTTNHQSRQNARRFEKLAAHLAARKVTLLANGKVGLAWSRKDPDFKDMVAGAKALPGRRFNWDTETNEVDATQEMLTFANDHDMEVPAEVIAAVEGQKVARQEAAAAEAARPQVGLTREGKIIVSREVTWDADVRSAIAALPGRRWNGTNNEVDASPEAAALFARLGLVVSDNAKRALTQAGEEALIARQSEGEKLSRAALMAQASRANSIDDLPADFIALINEAMGR